jgi:hypothetical protein
LRPRIDGRATAYPPRNALDALGAPTVGGSPERLPALSRYMETMRAHRNVDGGFWVAAVDPLAAEHALTGTVPVDRVRAAAILSYCHVRGV